MRVVSWVFLNKGAEGRRALWDDAESTARHKGRREVFQWMWHTYSLHHTQHTHTFTAHTHNAHNTHTKYIHSIYTQHTHALTTHTTHTYTHSTHTHTQNEREKVHSFPELSMNAGQHPRALVMACSYM